MQHSFYINNILFKHTWWKPHILDLGQSQKMKVGRYGGRWWEKSFQWKTQLMEGKLRTQINDKNQSKLFATFRGDGTSMEGR